MAFLKNTLGSGPEIEFLSTHPSHEKRSEYLDTLMDEVKLKRYAICYIDYCDRYYNTCGIQIKICDKYYFLPMQSRCKAGYI